MKLRFSARGAKHDVDAVIKGSELECAIDGAPARSFECEISAEQLQLQRDGRRWRARFVRKGREIYLHLDGRSWHLHEVDAQEQEDLEAAAAEPVLRAPMPGRVLELLAEPGAEVEQGAALIRVEAMKMEVDLYAPIAGTVREIHVSAGQLVEPEALLITLEPRAS